MAKGKTYANINAGPLTWLFKLKIVIIITNWTFQGLLYADKTEKVFKCSLDLALAIILFLIIPYPEIVIRMIIAIIFSHTFNWIFNGQLFALAKNFGIVSNEPEKFINYANGIKERASMDNSIDRVLIYGSLSRDEIKPTSDLDVRVIRKPGLVNGVRACMFGFIERTRALFNKFPLDIYIIDSEEHLLKMRHDETPIIL